MAVKKPCGLKNPVIQNTLGRPLNTHVKNCVLRSISSVYQKPIVEDSQEIWKKNTQFYQAQREKLGMV